jgi:uncharacterized protein YndB with AHSA1/START domain
MQIMSIAQSKAGTRDFESVKVFEAAPDAVLAALTSSEAINQWWGLTVGSPARGQRFEVGFGGERRIDMEAVTDGPSRVEWYVHWSPFTPEWAGTSIVFELAPAGAGTELRFSHRGLTPELECFDMCHEGWTHYLTSLVDYVDRGEGQPYRGE